MLDSATLVLSVVEGLIQSALTNPTGEGLEESRPRLNQ